MVNIFASAYEYVHFDHEQNVSVERPSLYTSYAYFYHLMSVVHQSLVSSSSEKKSSPLKPVDQLKSNINTIPISKEM